jgi:hypothetical protein
MLFFDRAMLAMGNVRPPHSHLIRSDPSANAPRKILFLAGLTLIIGLQKTAIFFARRQKLKGTAAFVAGIVLILIRYPLIGFLVELYGIFVLFGDFLLTIAGFVGNVPVVGPYIARGLEAIAGQRRGSELPV